MPLNAVIGVSDQMAGAAMLYGQREVFIPGNFSDPAQQFPQFLTAMKNENRAVFLLGDWDCTPDADASQQLPKWMAEYGVQDSGTEIGGLPYGCAQKVREIQK